MKMFVLTSLVLLVAAPPARSAPEFAAAPPAATRTLVRRLHAAGRAEARVRASIPDPLTGRSRVVRGTLALELPQFARLDFESGERLTLRADGGEWLQPATRQLIRAGAESVGGILDWWGVLLPGGAEHWKESRIGPREFRLRAEDADSSDDEGQRVHLGADGLPDRIEVISGVAEPRRYDLSGWRFVRARGPVAFTLAAPAGFEIVRMP
jgi:hypothetical protein